MSGETLMSADPPHNKYAHLVPRDELRSWHRVFTLYDRDGGGDVDLKELGLMMRQMGQAPSESEMLRYIDEVDADSSGPLLAPRTSRPRPTHAPYTLREWRRWSRYHRL